MIAPPTVAADGKPTRLKFTMLFDSAEDEQMQALAEAVITQAGIRPTRGVKADIIRAMIALAVQDERLQQKVAALVRQARGTPPWRA